MPSPLRFMRIHGPVLALLLTLVGIVFGSLTSGELWSADDLAILVDAHELSQNPWAMFRHIGAWFSQPLLQLLFTAEYQLFGLTFGWYLAVNLLLHALNAFGVYMLVNMLFFRPRLAMLAGVLFALGVGSYGRNLLNIAGQESLLLGSLHLSVLYLFIRNDHRRHGQLWSPHFVLALAIYSLTGLTKASTLSLLGCIVAYKAFFYHTRDRRPVFSNDLLVFLAVGLLFQIGQSRWGYQWPTVGTEVEGPLVYTYLSLVNVLRYLNLMVFPLQESSLLRDGGLFVQVLYDLRTVVRAFVSLYVLSFSFFGFVFGSRPLRFFIAWTYITLIPLSAQAPGSSWLNLTHLYLASLGFCVVLASGAIGAGALLGAHRWRQLVPMLVPAVFAAAAVSLTYRLDARNQADARTPAIEELREETIRTIQRAPGQVLRLP